MKKDVGNNEQEKSTHGGENATPPRDKKNYKGDPSETPFIVDEFDQYFSQGLEDQPELSEDQETPDDQWFWHDPEEFWLEEGMWPRPESPQNKETNRKRPDEVGPDETEPKPLQ